MKNLKLSNTSLTELTTNESISIDGGDVDGLMRGEGPSIDNLTTNLGYVAGWLVGAFQAIF